MLKELGERFVFLADKKNRGSFKLIILTAILFTLSVTAVFSLDNSAKSKSVIVGYYNNEVFQEGGKTGEAKSGYAYEYYQKLSEYTGWRYEYVYGDFNSVYKQFLDGKVDLIAGLAYNKERESILLYPDMPMGNTPYYLIKKSSNSEISSNLVSLNGKSIGVIESIQVSILKQWLFDKNIRADVHIYGSLQKLIDSYKNNEIEVAFVEGAGAYTREDSEALAIVGSSDYYLCVNKNRPDLLLSLNEAQSQINQDDPNFKESLYAKFYQKSLSSKVLSETEKKWVDAHSEIKVGFLTNYLPYSDVTNKDEVTGLIQDIIPDIFQSLNVNKSIAITYHPYSSTEQMITALNSEEIDVAFPIGGGLFYSELRNIHQSSSVVRSTVNLVHNKKYKPENPKRFAINKNNVMQENYVRKNYPEAEIIYCDSINDCFFTIKRQKDVCTTINGLRTKTLLKNLKYSFLDYRTLEKDDERCFGVSIGNEGLLRLLNHGLNNISSQYILDHAYRYTDDLYKYTAADFFKNNSIFIFCAIILIILIVLHFFFMDNKKNKEYIENQTKKNEELNKAQEELRVQLEVVKNLNLQLKHSQDDTSKFIMEMIYYASTETNADEVLNKLITFIGNKIKSDRVYIFERNSKGSYDNTYEWCKEGVTAEKDNLQDVPSDVMEPWFNEFSKSNTVIIEDIEAYKNISEPIYEILKPQCINTLIAAPIVSYREVTGFFGIDNPPKENLEYLSDFFSMVEFIFSMMIRIRDNTNEIEITAKHDQLTGCLNRKALAWAYEKNYDKSKTCGIVSVDMNGLKKVNDSQGHGAGDKFICRMAETLTDIYGKENVYRMGGDEFVIVLLDKTKEEFDKLLADCKLLVGSTASLGGVYEENLEKGFDNLLRLSDQDMYHEKDLFYQSLRK